MPDWGDTRRRDTLSAFNVDLFKCAETRGALVGLDPGSIEVNEGYYTDTRVQAQLSTVTVDGEDGWDGGRIRLVHSFPGYSRDMMTGYVTELEVKEEGGLIRREYTLDSTLYSISQNTLNCHYSVGAQASMLRAVRGLLDGAFREHDLSTAKDRVIQSPTVWEVGEDVLSVVFDLAGDTDRVDVDGMGRVVLSPYEPPSQRSPSLTIAGGGRMVVGEITHTTDRFSTPGRIIVKSGSGDDVVFGTYDAPASAQSAWQTRGYLVGKVESTTTENPTAQQLVDEARRSWEASQDTGEEWGMTVLWMDLHAGDVVNLDWHGTRKCLVKSAVFSCGDMTEKITLKGV